MYEDIRFLFKMEKNNKIYLHIPDKRRIDLEGTKIWRKLEELGGRIFIWVDVDMKIEPLIFMY